MKCLNCNGPHVHALSWVPCLFCGGLMNPCATKLDVTVTYADGLHRSGQAHAVCTAAEKEWRTLGLAPREVNVK
jgi:hypothetical protein